ncbi:MAG: hypothetical protein KC417_09525 [Myxococcales bacterium]|nr:hypothetical protein [Myxococcales bacterium]
MSTLLASREAVLLFGGVALLVGLAFVASRVLRSLRHGFSVRLQLFFAILGTSLMATGVIGLWVIERLQARAAELALEYGAPSEALVQLIREFGPKLTTVFALLGAGAAGAAFALLVHGRRLTATFDALPPLRRHLSTLLAAVVFLGAAVQFNTHAYGVGVVQDRYPDGALAFARAHGLDARPLNTFQLGGYVIWAGQDRFKVLIDGRNDLLYPDAFFREVSDGQESAEGFGRIANRFESTWVLASNEPGRETFLQAGHVPPWTEVYWSEPAVIYARMDAYPGLRGMAFRYLQADDLLGSLGRAFGAAQRDPAVLSSVERELARMHAASPHGLRVLTLLTLFHDARGPAGAALRDKYFADLVSTYPDHPAVFEVARRLAGRPQVPATSNDTRGNAP